MEQAFRDIKSILEPRPVFHQRDETIRRHVFCSFLALIFRKELDRRLDKFGHCSEWSDIKQDLKPLQKIVIEDHGKFLALRAECSGTCARSFILVVWLSLPSFERCKTCHRGICGAKNYFHSNFSIRWGIYPRGLIRERKGGGEEHGCLFLRCPHRAQMRGRFKMVSMEVVLDSKG